MLNSASLPKIWENKFSAQNYTARHDMNIEHQTLSVLRKTAPHIRFRNNKNMLKLSKV